MKIWTQGNQQATLSPEADVMSSALSQQNMPLCAAILPCAHDMPLPVCNSSVSLTPSLYTSPVFLDTCLFTGGDGLKQSLEIPASLARLPA